MIRFVIGLFLIMGGVGGLEQDTATITQALITCGIGLGFMFWALPKIASEA